MSIKANIAVYPKAGLCGLNVAAQRHMKQLLLIACLLITSFEGKTQIITTIAGGGVLNTGDGGPATNATTPTPAGMCLDKQGNLYFTGGLISLRVRKVTPDGIISTVAGNGLSGSSGDGGPATNAKFRLINSLCIDNNGNIYVADQGDHRVRRIDGLTGIITNFAGTGVYGYSGDGGPATNAQLYGPADVRVDKHGNVFIADHMNYRIRKVATNGIITSVVGNGSTPSYYGGDGGRADTTAMRAVLGLCLDDTGNLYISDYDSRIVKVDTFGIIRTYAGNGLTASMGEGIPATAASVHAIKMCMDQEGNMYLSEYTTSHTIRKIGTDGIITTVVGTGISGHSGDGGPATSATFNGPWGVVTDTCGNLYIADALNYRVRKVFFYPECPDTTGDDPAAVAGDVVKQDEILVIPNPASDVITITSRVQLAYTLTGITGRIITSGTIANGTQSIAVGYLPSGMYFITTTSPQGTRRVQKIVKE